MALTDSITASTAAAGDPFNATLTEALRDPHGKLLARKGTLVEGHLLRVETFVHPAEVAVVLRPEALLVRDARVSITATRDWSRALAEAKRKGKKGVEMTVPRNGEDYAGEFRFSGNDVIVPKGFRSEWETVQPLPPPKTPSGR